MHSNRTVSVTLVMDKSEHVRGRGGGGERREGMGGRGGEGREGKGGRGRYFYFLHLTSHAAYS